MGLLFDVPCVEAKDNYIEGVILKGENAQKILTRYISMAEFRQLTQATEKVYDLSKLRQDYVYALVTTDKNALKAFSCQISRDKKLVAIVDKKNNFKVSLESVDFDILPLETEKQNGKKKASQHEIEVSSIPINADGQPVDPNAQVRIDDEVKRGENAQMLFDRCMGNTEFHNMCAAIRDVYNLSHVREGRPYSLVYFPNASVGSKFVSFKYFVDDKNVLIVTKDEAKGQYKAKLDPIQYDVQLAVVRGSIRSSLFNAITDLGEGPELVGIMADIFGSEINFVRDIRSGDSFQIAVEKCYSKGSFVRYGRVLGVRFVQNGETYIGIRFPGHGKKGDDRYYNMKGESLSGSVLKSPVDVVRISSHYSQGRKHPVFKDIRAHLGVDYAATAGTPVRAVAGGKVMKVGWGTGFGKMVIIQHEDGMESQYAHLSKYAPSLNKGQYVRQGQIIGYVGMTGWATGPHLDFRIRKDGRYINPEKVVSTRFDPVNQRDRKAFEEQKKFVLNILDGSFSLASYKPGMKHLSVE